MDALVLERVSHAYDGVMAVESIDLKVGAGELVCLLGPSGCGKTTVLRLAAGLEELKSGRIVVNGREVARPGASLPPEARGVGLVFQDYALFPHMTVAGNVAFGLEDLSASERSERVMDMLARVGMAELAERYPHTISGGEQQRVALARALATRPALLLLDEPFSGLDIRLRDRVRDETLRILAQEGISTLIVTHDPEEAMYMADRIAVMRQGRILQEGTPAHVYRSPATAFIASFLSDVNFMHGVVNHGSVTIPLGELAASSMADGARVDVLVRPEDLRIADGAIAGAVAAEVVDVHLLGHSSIVVLRLVSNGCELRARLSGTGAPKPGMRVAVAFDCSRAVVFPCSASNLID